jgi:hypothetical protein
MYAEVNGISLYYEVRGLAQMMRRSSASLPAREVSRPSDVVGWGPLSII